MFDAWVKHLVRVYNASQRASEWLIATAVGSKPLMKQLFLVCPFEHLRVAYAEIFRAAMTSLARKDEVVVDGAVDRPIEVRRWDDDR